MMKNVLVPAFVAALVSVVITLGVCSLMDHKKEMYPKHEATLYENAKKDDSTAMPESMVNQPSAALESVVPANELSSEAVPVLLLDDEVLLTDAPAETEAVLTAEGDPALNLAIKPLDGEVAPELESETLVLESEPLVPAELELEAAAEPVLLDEFDESVTPTGEWEFPQIEESNDDPSVDTDQL